MEDIHKKIGILTLPLSTNYGGVLQAYALQHYLKGFNYDVWLINRRWNNERKDLSYLFKKWIFKNIISYHFTKFIENYICPKTIPITSFDQMKQIINRDFDTIIVGSDQVWRTEHTRGVGYNYFFDCIENKEVKKIAYAASFGIDNVTCDKQEIPQIKDLLTRFNAISLREDSGLRILESEFGLSGEHVIDPTLLLNKEQYCELISSKDDILTKNMLTTYVLDNNMEVETIISKISRTKMLNVIPVNSSINEYVIKNFFLNPNSIIRPSISKWLSGFKNADYIVTDSFHGTVFSIIFNKPFICIGNKERGLTRFQSLLKMFELEDRLVLEVEDLSEKLINRKIDYDKVNEILVNKKDVATRFLMNNI